MNTDLRKAHNLQSAVAIKNVFSAVGVLNINRYQCEILITQKYHEQRLATILNIIDRPHLISPVKAPFSAL